MGKEIICIGIGVLNSNLLLKDVEMRCDIVHICGML